MRTLPPWRRRRLGCLILAYNDLSATVTPKSLHFGEFAAGRQEVDHDHVDATPRTLAFRSGAEVHLALTRLNVRPLFVGAEALNDCVAATIADDIFPAIRLRRSDAVVFRPDNGHSIEPRVRGSVEPAPGAAGTVTRVDPGSEYGLTLAHVAFGGTMGTWIVPESSLHSNPKITAES